MYQIVEQRYQRLSSQQKEKLLEMVQEGKLEEFKGLQYREQRDRWWKEASVILNSMPGGRKTPEQWNKAYKDLLNFPKKKKSADGGSTDGESKPKKTKLRFESIGVRKPRPIRSKGGYVADEVTFVDGVESVVADGETVDECRRFLHNKIAALERIAQAQESMAAAQARNADNFDKLIDAITKYLENNKYGTYERVTAGIVSARRSVPPHINIPVVEPTQQHPQIRSINDLVRMREACQSARKILDFASQLVKVGVTTDAIDAAAHERCMQLGVYPSPLGYKGFPKSVCTSVNNVVCHGIPDDRPLRDGDIINVDVTVFQNGYHGDCSRTLLVGSVDEAGQDIVTAAEACLDAGIGVCRDGVPFAAIGDAVEEEAAQRGMNVVPEVAGHGIGQQFHELPDIYHFSGSPYEGVMRSGMTFTIEPAVTEGSPEIKVLEDGWTCVTVDGARSAQAEHTLLITDDGCEVLTLGRSW